MAAAKGVGILQKAKLSITSPSKVFASVKAERNFKEPFVYYAVVSLIYTLLAAVLSLILMSQIPQYSALLNFVLVGSVISWIIGLITVFITAAISHAFVYLLGGKAGYLQTFKSYVYGMTPALLLGWIPYVNIAAALYSWLYMLPKGLTILQNMSFGRALAVVLIPIAVIAVLVIAFSVAFISYLLPGVTAASSLA